jgi:hypothetical protein
MDDEAAPQAAGGSGSGDGGGYLESLQALREAGYTISGYDPDIGLWASSGDGNRVPFAEALRGCR